MTFKNIYRSTILFCMIKLYKLIPFKLRNKLSKTHRFLYVKNKNLMKYSFVLGFFIIPFEYMAAGTVSYQLYTDHECPKERNNEDDFKSCLYSYNDILINRADDGYISTFKKKNYKYKKPIFKQSTTGEYTLVSTGTIDFDYGLENISLNVFREDNVNYNVILGVKEEDFYHCHNIAKENKEEFYKLITHCIYLY